MKTISIAIDGPAAAGKSTIAKIVATKKNLLYIDTGAMYRSFTWYCLKNGVDCTNEKACCDLISSFTMELKEDGKVICDNQDVTEEIRGSKVSSNVSFIASYKEIRLALVEIQRNMSKNNNVIMDGRDIGTYVLPNADVKIFQIASVETRAKRRYLENLEKGRNTTYEEVLKDVKNRDNIDSNRAFAPLKPAEDSILLDTSDLNIEQSVEKVIEIIDKKLGK